MNKKSALPIIIGVIAIAALVFGFGVFNSANNLFNKTADTVDNITETITVADNEDEDHSHEDGDDHSHDEDEEKIDSDTSDSSDIVLSGFNIDDTKFFDGALTEEIETIECELSNGETSTCYNITILGAPSNTDIGPSCPTSLDDTAEDVGIWFDGDNLYDVDGEFIKNLPEIYDDEKWILYDEDGNVRHTDSQEDFNKIGGQEPLTEEDMFKCVDGILEWLPNGEPISASYTIPAEPQLADSSSNITGKVGVTLNGVTLDSSAPVERILGDYNIGAFDDCGGHMNPDAGYHLHGVTGCSEYGEAEEGETPMMGYAMDGFPIHSPYAEGEEPDDLDECNGHVVDGEYHYHANDAKFNAILDCFVGAIAGGGNAGGPGAGGPPGGGQPPQR